MFGVGHHDHTPRNVWQILMPTFNNNWTYLKDKPVISRESDSLSHLYEILSVELSGYSNILMGRTLVMSPKSLPCKHLKTAQSSDIIEKLVQLTSSIIFPLWAALKEPQAQVNSI